jgi:hypothetical protein
MEKFTIIVDEDEIPIATTVFGNEGQKYDLKKDLRLAQLRKLAKCVGVKGHNSMSKHVVCRLVAKSFTDGNKMNQAGINPEKTIAKKTNTVCRLINLLFSVDFIDRFLGLNGLHNRTSHETKQTYKSFWSDIFKEFQNTEDDEDLLKIYGVEKDEHLQALEDDENINFCEFTGLSEEAIRTHVRDLFRVRGKIISNMTQPPSCREALIDAKVVQSCYAYNQVADMIELYHRWLLQYAPFFHHHSKSHFNPNPELACKEIEGIILFICSIIKSCAPLICRHSLQLLRIYQEDSPQDRIIRTRHV